MISNDVRRVNYYYEYIFVYLSMYVCMYECMYEGGFGVDRSVHVCVCGCAHGMSSGGCQVHHAVRVPPIQVQTRST